MYRNSTTAVLSPSPQRPQSFGPGSQCTVLCGTAHTHPRCSLPLHLKPQIPPQDAPPIWPTEFAWNPAPPSEWCPPAPPQQRSPSRHHAINSPHRFPPPAHPPSKTAAIYHSNSNNNSPTRSPVVISYPQLSPLGENSPERFHDALEYSQPQNIAARLHLPGNSPVAARQAHAFPEPQQLNSNHQQLQQLHHNTLSPYHPAPSPHFLPSQPNINLHAFPQPVFSPSATTKATSLSSLPMVRKRKSDPETQAASGTQEPPTKRGRPTKKVDTLAKNMSTPGTAVDATKTTTTTSRRSGRGALVEQDESQAPSTAPKKTAAATRKKAALKVATPADATDELPKKRGRGRPKKVPVVEDTVTVAPIPSSAAKAPAAKPTPKVQAPVTVKRGRGRPKKSDVVTEQPTPSTEPELAVKKSHNIYDEPSMSSDELSRPAIATPASTRRKRAPTATAKTPASRTRTTKVAVGFEDELSHPTPMAAGKATPKTRASAKSTPKTVMKNDKPPRTRKKGTSAPPKNEMNGKLGVGVPGEQDITPSTRRKVRYLDLEQEESQDNVINAEEEYEEVIAVIPDVDDQDLDAEGEDDEDLDVINPSGKIVPKTPGSTTRTGNSKKRQSIVLGGETVDDPFSIPSISLTKSTPKLGGKKTLQLVPQPVEASKKYTSNLKVDEESIQALQKAVLGKLMGRERLELVGLDEEYSQVHQLMEQTVTAGEGNSMLIIGARGSGKTTLVENAITELSDTHQGEFHTVRLNGFLQTDDKLAVREIWRQLGVEMELDENEQPQIKNFADTLASILAILSHPDELQPEGGDPDAMEIDTARTATAVLFILDEFDLFVSHPRQTLLYNLFDIAQAKKAPIAVLGLTSKVDVVDSLEKRVKSRFSHRSIHIKLPASVDNFWNIIRAGLTAPLDTDPDLSNMAVKYFTDWNDHYLPYLHATPEFTKLLRRHYNTTKTPAALFNASLAALSSLSPESPFPVPLAYSPTASLSPPTSNLSLLPSLSDLQLALLIAAARLETLSVTETVTFEMVYDEYVKLTAKTRVQATPSGGSVGRVWGKAVARGAWEGLGTIGLIIEASGSRGAKTWRVDVGLMEVKEGVRGSVWMRWCREVL